MKQPYRVLDTKQTGNEACSLRDELSGLVIGQGEATEQIASIYQMQVTGLTAPGRPVGSFLFLGPTGSGKTRTVEATAEALTGNPRAVIKIDCAEFQHSHEIAKLIGSPPGYFGHRETHPLLSQEVLDQHHTETVKLSSCCSTKSRRPAMRCGICCSESWIKPRALLGIIAGSISRER